MPPSPPTTKPSELGSFTKFLSYFITTQSSIKVSQVPISRYHHLAKRRVRVNEESVLQIQRCILAIMHPPNLSQTNVIIIMMGVGLTYTKLIGLSSLNILDNIPVMSSTMARLRIMFKLDRRSDLY
jgi:hypothetical protein